MDISLGSHHSAHYTSHCTEKYFSLLKNASVVLKPNSQLSLKDVVCTGYCMLWCWMAEWAILKCGWYFCYYGQCALKNNWFQLWALVYLFHPLFRVFDQMSSMTHNTGIKLPPIQKGSLQICFRYPSAEWRGDSLLWMVLRETMPIPRCPTVFQ